MLIFAVVLAIFIGTAIGLISYFTAPTEQEPTTVEKPPIMEWESYYRNYAIAYPQVDDSLITAIAISNEVIGEDGKSETRRYLLERTEKTDGDFLISYERDGKFVEYWPSILDKEDDFYYSDLYAKETEDGYGMLNKIYYLLAALEIPYFGERIPLSEDTAEREKQLRSYGFSQDDPKQVITFDYKEQTEGKDTEDTKDDKYETKRHKIEIGSKTLANAGRYFRLDDREYVYNSNSNYYDYALLNFYSYINGRLVAAGLKNDSTFEPTLTPNFTHWNNDLFDEGEVEENSKVTVLADLTVPINPYDAKKDPEKYKDSNGYIVDEDTEEEFDLKTAFEAEIKALLGKSVGKYDEGELTFTLTSASGASKGVSFDLDGESHYLYTVYAIESIVGCEMPDGSSLDVATVGTPVADNKLIKVSYKFSTYDKDGNFKRVTDVMCHAVIDLTNETIPAEAREKLRAASVGELSEAVEFSIAYTKENASKNTIQLEICEILEVHDKNGRVAKTISSDSWVGFRYRMVVNGQPGEKIGAHINLGEKTESTYFNSEKIAELLVGKTVSKDISVIIYESDSYYEVFYDFYTYDVKEIEYYVTGREIVSFTYLNTSERDPFYGESIYENNTDGYESYGLNSERCEYIVRILGGVGSQDSTTSEGLVGETVDVGITPEKMRKYGLYSHTVYFEMRREIITIDSGADDIPDDYDSYNILGVTLYISDEDSEGNRHVASDLYDVIAKIDGEKFDFVERTFVDYWARENLIQTNVANLLEMDLEFSMDNLKGTYHFTLNHTPVYIVPDENGKTGITYVEPESYIDTYDMINVVVNTEGECTENALTKFLESKEMSQTTLATLYNYTVGGGKPVYVQNSYDPLGTGSFKDAILSLFFVQYEGSVDGAEQDAAIEDGELVMKFSFKIANSKFSKYTYEFYRYKDRRVLVRLYPVNSEGNKVEAREVSDFYISTFAFKKIVGNFLTVLNGEELDIDKVYY